MSTIPKATRGEIVKWLNSTLLVSISSIEKAYNGALACQIIDLLFPNTISMSRVNFLAKEPFECQKNYRLLQNAFTLRRIQFTMNIESLSKGRPQDNLELLQFLKSLYDQSEHDPNYNAIQRRELSKGGKSLNITLTDLEIMETELVVNSGRLSVESGLSQKANINSIRAALTSENARPTPNRSINRLQISSPSLLQKEINELKETNRKLEAALVERDHLINSLQKEGTSMFYALRKVEEYLQQGLEAGNQVADIKQCLSLIYQTYEIQHPEEEDKWKNDGLSIEVVEDSFQN